MGERQGKGERSDEHSSHESRLPFCLQHAPLSLGRIEVSAPCNRRLPETKSCSWLVEGSGLVLWGSRSAELGSPMRKARRRVGSSIFWPLDLTHGLSPSEPSLCSPGHLRTRFPPAIPVALGNSAVSRWSQAPALCLARWSTVSLFMESATPSESGVLGPSGSASVGFGARETGFKGWLSPYLCVALGKSPNFPALSFLTWEWA